jgi:lantibiotic biosynthesis protein
LTINAINTTQNHAFFKLQQLEKAISNEIFTCKNMGLMEGVSGLALLYTNFYIAQNKEEYISKAQLVLNKTLDDIGGVATSLSLCNGLTGKAMVLSIIQDMDIFEMDIEDVLSDCDKMLLYSIQNNDTEDSLDYIHGSLGVAYYFYNRRKGNKIRNENYRLVLKNVLQRIDYYIDSIEGYNVNSNEDLFLNLGFAHGILSVIVFLAKNISQKKNIETQLRKLLQILLSFENKGKDGISKFPAILNLKNKIVDAKKYDVPLGWCYGDLIIAYSIYIAGEALRDFGVTQKAEIIASDTCKKLSQANYIINDACFCHGSSGLAYLYKKLYNLSGNIEFKRAYLFCINKTIELCNFENGIGGYKKFSGKEYENNIGILDGAAGPAIVLMDYLYESSDSSWAKVFMID